MPISVVKSVIIGLVLLAVAVVKQTDAISCYVCSSSSDSACADDPWPSSSSVTTYSGFSVCYVIFNFCSFFNLCILIFILQNGKASDGSVYRSGISSYTVAQCQAALTWSYSAYACCDTDLCNSGIEMKPLAMISGIVLPLVAFNIISV